MPNRFCAAAVIVLVVTGQSWSQNADMSNEPTSGDLLLLQVLRNQRSIGSASVLPPQLGSLLSSAMPRDTFQRYLATYYWPLADSLARAWELLPVHGGRHAFAAARDSVLTVRLDASAAGRGGLLDWNGSDLLATGRLSMRALGRIGEHWSFLLDLAKR